jgi:D-alanine-D-alanine ligase
MADQRTGVAVVFGGRSGEYDVSCRSGLSVIQNLDRDRYDVRAVRITPDGRWVPSADVGVDATLSELLDATVDASVGTVADSITDAMRALQSVDVMFPALHGPYGEDGTIQSVLEMFGTPYVGSGVFASAAGQDKEFTKKLLAAAGLPVAAGVVLRDPRATVGDVDRVRLGLPMFVKPARAGSSIGVSKVEAWDELDGALARARAIDRKVLVEETIHGREVNCAVLEHPDGRLEVGPVSENRITAEHVFLDYEAKYSDPDTVIDIPARLDPAIVETLQDFAVRAFRTLDCSGLLRVDFLLRHGTEPVLNEVNTFPGFTPKSLFPQIFQASGIAYPTLLDALIQTALARRRSRPAIER